MRLHGKDKSANTLGADFRLIGLAAAIQRVKSSDKGQEGQLIFTWSELSMLHCVSMVMRQKKIEWLDAIFNVIDEHYGYFWDSRRL